jgi:transposase
LTECAWGATRKKDGFLKRKYYSLSARRGNKKAIFAIGHKILIASYFILRDLEPYKEPVEHENQKLKKRQIKYHVAKLKELGVAV